jgi:hypothetical protein
MSKHLFRRTRAHGPTLAALAGSTAVLAGCASPPPYTAVNHQRLVPLAAADVWRRLHSFLQDQGIHVVSEDAAAGLIDARQESAAKGLLASYADCGATGGLLRTMERQTLNLTIRIRPAADGAEVTANAAFSQTLHARHAGAVTVTCTSKGVLESAVLEVASGQPMEAAVIPH